MLPLPFVDLALEAMLSKAGETFLAHVLATLPTDLGPIFMTSILSASERALYLFRGRRVGLQQLRLQDKLRGLQSPLLLRLTHVRVRVRYRKNGRNLNGKQLPRKCSKNI